MKSKSKRVIAALLVALLVGVIVAVGCAPGEAPEVEKPELVRINYGAGSASSGYFVWHVALSRVIDKYCPGISLTVIETGATIDDLNGLRDGYWDIAGHGGSPGCQGRSLIRGVAPFEGKPYAGIRYVIVRQTIYYAWCVPADSDIYTLSDLAGKKFCPGYTGSAAADAFRKTVEVTGIPADIWPATWGDALTALKDGRIVGVCKSCPCGHLDASLVEVNLTKPLRIIGGTKEQLELVKEKYPYLTDTIKYVPMGGIEGFPDCGDFWVQLNSPAISISDRLSQEVVYKMVKAWIEHYDEVVQIFPTVAGVRPLADLIENMPTDGEVMLAAGAVQYAKEIGVDVPDYLIPPEYVEVR